MLWHHRVRHGSFQWHVLHMIFLFPVAVLRWHTWVWNQWGRLAALSFAYHIPFFHVKGRDHHLMFPGMHSSSIVCMHPLYLCKTALYQYISMLLAFRIPPHTCSLSFLKIHCIAQLEVSLEQILPQNHTQTVRPPKPCQWFPSGLTMFVFWVFWLCMLPKDPYPAS